MSDPNAHVLEMRDVAVHFGGRGGLFGASGQVVKAVNGVDLTIGRGETVALVGESGCGKSTLSNTIVGLQAPVSGSIRVGGEEVVGADRRKLNDIRRHVQMIFQDPALSLDPRSTIGATVGEPLKVRGVAKGEALKQRVGELLTQVGLRAEHADRYPHQFSGGQRQRIGLARAVFGNPKLVILDEPNANLDQAGENALAATLRDLKLAGAAILIVGHRPSTLAQADKLLLLKDGKVELYGSREEVLGRLRIAAPDGQRVLPVKAEGDASPEDPQDVLDASEAS